MSTQRPRILIIDDDPLYRSLMTTLLRKDYLLAVAADGAEGYQKALQHPPDIAVIDIQMPGWDGLKTLEQFRKNPILKRVKIIMLTGDASKESVVAAIRGGANDYVIKTSFSREEFREKLKRLSTKPISTGAAQPGSAQPATAQPAAAQPASNVVRNTPQTPQGQIQHVDQAVGGTTQPASSHPMQVKMIQPASVSADKDIEDDSDLQTMIDSWE